MAAIYEARKVRRAFRDAVDHSQAKMPQFDAYKAISLRIWEIFAAYTPIIEPLSLDEGYLDVLRPIYGPDYYAALIIDPDGYRVEAYYGPAET